MSNEPMFNIEERSPLWLAGVLIAIHLFVTLGPQSLVRFVRYWGLLVPYDLPDVPATRQLVSLVGSGFLHGSWTHVLVNSGMIVAFAVITMRGMRARIHERQKSGQASGLKAPQAFLLIFLLGVVGGNLFQWGWWAAINTAQAYALGASGGGAAFFATAAWAMGGRERLIKFAGGWALLNVIFVIAEPIFGGIAWPAHIGGYVVGALLAPYLVRPFSTGFSITR